MTKKHHGLVICPWFSDFFIMNFIYVVSIPYVRLLVKKANKISIIINNDRFTKDTKYVIITKSTEDINMDKTLDIDRTIAKSILQNKGLGNGEELNEFEVKRAEHELDKLEKDIMKFFP